MGNLIVHLVAAPLLYCPGQQSEGKQKPGISGHQASRLVKLQSAHGADRLRSGVTWAKDNRKLLLLSLTWAIADNPRGLSAIAHVTPLRNV